MLHMPEDITDFELRGLDSDLTRSRPRDAYATLH